MKSILNSDDVWPYQALFLLLFCLVWAGRQIYLVYFSTGKGNSTKKSANDVVNPPHIPSWIPYFGAAGEMGSSVNWQFLNKYAKQFNSPVFSGTVLGKKLIFLADPRLVSSLYLRGNENLDYDSIKQFILVNVVDCPKKDASALFTPEASKFFHHQVNRDLTSPEAQQIAMERTLPWLEEEIEVLNTKVDRNDWTKVPLVETVRHHLYSPSVAALISEELADPALISKFEAFNEGFASRNS